MLYAGMGFGAVDFAVVSLYFLMPSLSGSLFVYITFHEVHIKHN